MWCLSFVNISLFIFSPIKDFRGRHMEVSFHICPQIVTMCNFAISMWLKHCLPFILKFSTYYSMVKMPSFFFIYKHSMFTSRGNHVFFCLFHSYFLSNFFSSWKVGSTCTKLLSSHNISRLLSVGISFGLHDRRLKLHNGTFLI